MKYITTRSEDNVTLSEAINAGLAPDGGLFVPEALSKIDYRGLDYQDIAISMLQPFFSGDQLEPHLKEICAEAFNFPCPLTPVKNDFHLLELFHGPTAAFKDFGARFLAQCFAKIPVAGNGKRTILVATSGDTGGAVAAAFDGVANTKVVLLFPKGGISPLQEHQLTCWSDNIISLRVDGTFDDCQKLVKDAFADHELKEKYQLTSANSINIARLLPQMTYYAYSSINYVNQNNKLPNYIIPTGNMGNAMACFWAKEVGLPIGDIILATNANAVIPHALHSGLIHPQKSVATLANAMDVGDPSNFERYINLNPNYKDAFNCYSVSDEQIKAAMTSAHENYALAICPHSATAFHVWQKQNIENAIVVATAHPAKFKEVSTPLNIETVMPESLESILKKPTKFKDINPKLSELVNNF